MKTIASGAVIHGKGNGVEVIINDIVDREIRLLQFRERQKHETEMAALSSAIELRDKVAEERHKLLGQRLAEIQRMVHPEPSLLREIKELCILALAPFVIAKIKICEIIRR